MYTYEYKDGMQYDVIGDIHGHFDVLVALLKKLGYVRERGEFGHLDFAPLSNRRALFIGDYIDRGPKNLQSVKLIASMVESGMAHAIMGNHDFNAVHFATPNPDRPGEYLRLHTEKNIHQHKVFLDEMQNSPVIGAHDSVIEWIKTLPVFLKIGNYNFVHACWQPSAIQTLIEGGYMDDKGVLNEKGWVDSANKSSPAYAAAELLLKGPEENLVNDYSYVDEQGEDRKRARIAWWKDAPATFGEAYASMPAHVAFLKAAYQPEADDLAARLRAELRTLPPQEKIFIGHIWETGTPKPLSDKVATVDYSIAKGEKLAAYHIGGPDIDLRAEDFIWVGYGEASNKREQRRPALQNGPS